MLISIGKDVVGIDGALDYYGDLLLVARSIALLKIGHDVACILYRDGSCWLIVAITTVLRFSRVNDDPLSVEIFLTVA